MRKSQPIATGKIGWERAQAIFNHPSPPRIVHEQQFDYCSDALDRLAKTPYNKIDFSDLWYYHHDLAYVELQPDLFEYLFLVCLMDWHQTLMNNQPCSHGDSEFHYGLYRGNVLEKMVAPQQRQAIYHFLSDSFLERLNSERGFVYAGMRTPAYAWICRFNSLGIVMPQIDWIWDAWWSLDTPGRAVAALQYCSDLMYLEGENPLFPAWTKEQGGGGPYIWANDSHLYDVGWLPCNLDFLRTTLTLDFVDSKLCQAANRLSDQPEAERARQMLNDFSAASELVELRVTELPELLSRVPSPVEGWSV